MTPADIRKIIPHSTIKDFYGVDMYNNADIALAQFLVQRELTAQLAELNASLRTKSDPPDKEAERNG